jgi:hypothetical protein
MWMSYSDAAPFLGYRHARPMANANWDPQVWTHLAKVDGTYLAENPERNHVFERDNGDLIAIIRAFGYDFPKPKPLAWRLSPEELRMLLGVRQSTAQFRMRLNERLDALLANADRLDGNDPHYDAVWDAVDNLRGMLARLYN